MVVRGGPREKDDFYHNSMRLRKINKEIKEKRKRTKGGATHKNRCQLVFAYSFFTDSNY